MSFKVLGMLGAIAAAVGLVWVGQPTAEEKLKRLEPELEARLSARQVQIDPAELLDLMVNNNVGLAILDVRDETDFNLFHIIDSQLTSLDQIRSREWVKRLPVETVIVLVSNDEARATEAWKLLAAQPVQNLYILAGGINLWLDVYGEAGDGAATWQASVSGGNDTLRHSFPAALGSNNPAADPDPHRAPARKYTKKVTSIGRAAPKAGSCG
jgi:rhodanese-related sulfurtransferase